MRLAILCYHKVGDEAVEGRRLCVHPDRLSSHIRFFQRRHYEFLLGSDLMEWPKQDSVCFTFDDGFVSTLENGLPVFEKHGVLMSIYIVSDLVGKTSEWEGELAKPLAHWDQLRTTASLGHEVGNHTARHPFLGNLGLDEQSNEIARCDAVMRLQGLEPKSFCFPYGSLNGHSAEALRQNHHAVGLALGGRLPKHADSKLALPRIVVGYGDGIPMLLYKLYIRAKVKAWTERDRPIGGPS